MVRRAIALGDRRAGRAAMNGQAAVRIAEFQHIAAHRRLPVHVAEAVAGHADPDRNPRLAFMRRSYFEAEIFHPTDLAPIGDGAGFVTVHRLRCLGPSGFITAVLRLLRIGRVRGERGSGHARKNYTRISYFKVGSRWICKRDSNTIIGIISNNPWMGD